MEENNIIQAYFFSKEHFDEKKVIKYLLDNDLPTIQKISESKYYYKIKLRSEKKLKLQGYQIIFKPHHDNNNENIIYINIAMKYPLVNNLVNFK